MMKHQLVLFVMFVAANVMIISMVTFGKLTTDVSELICSRYVHTCVRERRIGCVRA